MMSKYLNSASGWICLHSAGVSLHRLWICLLSVEVSLHSRAICLHLQTVCLQVGTFDPGAFKLLNKKRGTSPQPISGCEDVPACKLYICAYWPFTISNSSCDPCSTISPWSITSIRSAFLIVESL